MPVAGDYIFWLAGDNECQLWLSSDESPTKAKPIAWVSPYSPMGDFSGPEQKSSAIRLEAGKLYYLDLFHRENLGDTHAVVRWSKPGESELVPGEIVPSSALVTAIPQ
ncbi:MAG: PA14 domain-containing protein [Polyangiaceae bacterium]|nr:PA14 domain-containing protein [Polyangiaceae bacterium]